MSAHEQDLNETIAVLNARLEIRHIEATEQSGQIGDLKRELAEAEDVIEKVRELLFAFADWPDRDATDFLFRLGRHEMVYRIVGYAFPDELDKIELKPALGATETPGGES